MRRRVWPARAAACLTTAAFLLYLLLWGCPHYDLGDDAILMDAFFGAVGGTAENFNAHVLAPLTWILHGLGRLAPGVAWFSVYQLALLAASAYTTVESGMLLCRRLRMPVWLGWLAGTALAWILVVSVSNFITFTQTAAAAGMAAVWRAAAIDWRAQGRYRALAGSVCLLACAFCLRWESALPALCFWLGVLLCAGLAEGTPHRPLLTGAAVCLAALGLIGLLRVADVAFSGEKEYERWQSANVQMIDYGGLGVDDAVLEAAGWTENTLAAVQNWCMLDASVTADAFDIVTRAAERQAFSLSETLGRLQTLFGRHRNILWIAVLTLLLSGVAFLSLKGWGRAASVCCALATAALLFYLAAKGRLPMRAAAAVLWPACAVGAYLALLGGGNAFRDGRKCLCALCSLACAVLLVPNARQAFANTYQPYPMERESVYTRVERYALDHPDTLVIGTNALGRDPRLFPDRSQGVPNNLLLGWGSWNNYSKGYRAVMEHFGYGDGFHMADFVHGNVALAAKSGEEPPSFLVACMEEDVAAAVSWRTEAYDGFTIYQFLLP